MNLLMDDIRPYKEFAIKGCPECRFSTGGHWFAAVNGNTIQIYSTYTCEAYGNLRGHNGKVRSISWTADDARLVSAGMDGAVYEWQLNGFKRVSENVLKSCAYTCAVCTPDARSIYAVGSDMKLKARRRRPRPHPAAPGPSPLAHSPPTHPAPSPSQEISDSNINRDYESGCVISQVALSTSGRMLFAATEHGTIRSYKFPLVNEYYEIQVHAMWLLEQRERRPAPSPLLSPRSSSPSTGPRRPRHAAAHLSRRRVPVLDLRGRHRVHL